MNTDIENKALAMAKAVGLRFLKGAVAGAIAGVGAMSLVLPHTLAALLDSLYGLAYVAAFGFITGGLLAVEKWYNWTDTPPAA